MNSAARSRFTGKLSIAREICPNLQIFKRDNDAYSHFIFLYRVELNLVIGLEVPWIKGMVIMVK